MFNLKLILPLSVLVLALILSVYNQNAVSFFKSLFNKTHSSASLFTLTELQKYNGIDKPELYLAILGSVFDVTKGEKHYGSGKSYNIFVGRDGTRSFVTGRFNPKDVSDDITGFTYEELRSINHWYKFYKRDYTKVGKLIGRYYDNIGKPTQYHKEVKKLIKVAENEKENEALEKMKFPPCNIEWSAEHGSRVWCTKRSGGVQRNWVGVPRKLYEPGLQTHRCACISEENKHSANIREYEGCNPTFDSCLVKEN